MNESSTMATLGIATLANEPVRHLGFLGNADTFTFPVAYATADDAWSDRVLAADPGITPAWVDAARRLGEGGAAAIVTNCGFAVAYQAAMADAAAVPVATSSLLLVPFVLRTLGTSRPVGVLTADARQLGPAHLLDAGVANGDLDRIVIEGIQGSVSEIEMMKPHPVVDLDQLARDVVDGVDRLRHARPDVGAIVFECTGFGPVSDAVRRATGLPVFDVLVLSRLVMDACTAQVPGGTR